ncbi:MAG: hypothetical protein ACI94Y_002477 [Maribacter sp.]|jgi:hypothetical protein
MSFTERSITILKMVVILLLLAVVAVVVWKKFGSGGGDRDFDPNFDMGEGGTVSVPKEMQINYVPADFKTSMSADEVMRIMSNPEMYRRDFNKMIYQVNVDLLNHVATRMNLPDTIKSKVEKEYRKHHPYLKDLYYFDVLQLRDVGSSEYEKWYESDASNSVEVLNEVASKYTCFLVNHVMTTLIKTNKGTLYVKGKKVYSPCSVAMQEGLKPMVTRLEERAVVQDFRNSEKILEERMERVIAELATMEVKDVKGLNKELATKVWGYKVSTTDIEIRAVSIAKVGFKIDEYFDLKTDPTRKKVIVTLPQPKILSHEVFPKVDKLDIGWMRELSNDDFNDNFNLLRREFRRDIMESSVFEQSKKEAENLLNTILLPMVQSIDGKYTIEVQYRGNNLPIGDPDMN